MVFAGCTFQQRSHFCTYHLQYHYCSGILISIGDYYIKKIAGEDKWFAECLWSLLTIIFHHGNSGRNAPLRFCAHKLCESRDQHLRRSSIFTCSWCTLFRQVTTDRYFLRFLPSWYLFCVLSPVFRFSPDDFFSVRDGWQYLDDSVLGEKNILISVNASGVNELQSTAANTSRKVIFVADSYLTS